MLLSRAEVPRARGGKPAESLSPSSARPVDLVHLARQTCGDRTLEAEVLQLMHGQLRLVADRLRLTDAEERRALAHAICGAARNVGAFTLALAAERLEAEPWSESALLAFGAEADGVRAFIAGLQTS